MKKSIPVIIIVLIAIAFFSCEKAPPPPTITDEGPSSVQPVLTANLDGIPTTFVASVNQSYSLGRIIITGAAPESGINLTMPIPADTLTYTSFGSQVYAQVDTTTNNDSLQYTILVGTPVLRITSYNSITGVFSGTFSFTYKSLKGKVEVVTNGVFSNF